MAEDKTRSTDQPEDRQTDRHQQVNETGLSRRNFLKGLGAGAVAATVAPATLAEADSHGAATSAEITRATAKLNINQQEKTKKYIFNFLVISSHLFLDQVKYI